MRIIGSFSDKKTAQRFASFLAKEGIEAEMREEDDHEFAVWGYHDEQLPQSRLHYQEFMQDPSAQKFNAPLIALKKPEKPKAHRHRHVDVRSEVFGAGTRRNIVTMSLITISIVLTIMIEIPVYKWLREELMYSNYIRPMFLEIRQGQIWRLVTPIFLHAGFIHILFNMMWMHTLGGQIEQQEGSRFLLVFVLATAVTVNTAQYLVSAAPFLGMSGVVYALFGYMWMMIKYQIGCRYELSDFVVKLMLFWLVFCLFLPNVANMQHFTGAGIGAAFGLLRSGGLKSMIRRRRHKNRFK